LIWINTLIEHLHDWCVSFTTSDMKCSIPHLTIVSSISDNLSADWTSFGTEAEAPYFKRSQTPTLTREASCRGVFPSYDHETIKEG
jgi:hypothetical protein